MNWVLAAMLAAILSVTGLAWWDEQREANAALRDLQAQQSILASSLADGLRARLTTVERGARLLAISDTRDFELAYDPVVVRSPDAPRTKTPDPSRAFVTVSAPNGHAVDLGVSFSTLLGRPQWVPSRGDLTLLVSPPEDPEFHAMDGKIFSSIRMREALDEQTSSLRLTREEAAQVGLRARTAMAGLASVDSGAWDAEPSLPGERGASDRAVLHDEIGRSRRWTRPGHRHGDRQESPGRAHDRAQC